MQIGGNFSRSWNCCFEEQACCLERPKFSPAKTLHDCQGWRWNQLQRCRKKSLNISLKITVVFAFWSKHARVEGWCVCTCTGLRQTHARDPHLKPALRRLRFPLFQAFLFFNLFAPNIMFLFSCLIKYGFLCCVVDFSPLWSCPAVCFDFHSQCHWRHSELLKIFMALWVCLVLYGSSILDNGWGKIKMFREWLIMKWVYCMDDNFVHLPKKLYDCEAKKVFLKTKLGQWQSGSFWTILCPHLPFSHIASNKPLNPSLTPSLFMTQWGLINVG